MTLRDYENLDRLLAKLEKEVKGKLIIMPNHPTLKNYIGVYDKNGLLVKEASSGSIELTISKLKK
jgi:hypothetical protein